MRNKTLCLFAFLVLSLCSCDDDPRVQPTTEGKEFVVSQPTHIESLRGLSKLVIQRGGVLITDGKEVEIETNELISDEGIITSFDPTTRAAVGKDGRNGAMIHIKAKTGRGRLYIHGRGENGGEGLPGKTGDPGIDGKNGKDAVGNHGKSSFACECEERAENLKRRINAGDKSAVAAFNSYKSIHVCHRQPTDGEDGQQGNPGEQGGKGGRGGDASKILVELADPGTLEIKAYSLAGTGGKGGPPGKGGPGGKGGEAGGHKFDFYDVCGNAKSGENGAAGEEGMFQGSMGDFGSEAPYCLKIGSALIGNCERFDRF